MDANQVMRDVLAKIDKQGEDVTTIKVDIAVIKQQMRDMPPLPPRPCESLGKHLADHEETKTLWRAPIVRALIDVLKMGVIGAACFLIGKR